MPYTDWDNGSARLIRLAIKYLLKQLKNTCYLRGNRLSLAVPSFVPVVLWYVEPGHF